MWPVIRLTSVPPTPRCRRVTGHTKIFSAARFERRTRGSATTPARAPRGRGITFTVWTHCACHPSGVPCRWRRRFLTGRCRQRWSDDRRIPPARCPSAPQAREIPRPAPDACSAGTRNRGGAVHKVTAPPHHSAPRENVGRRAHFGSALSKGHRLITASSSPTEGPVSSLRASHRRLATAVSGDRCGRRPPTTLCCPRQLRHRAGRHRLWMFGCGCASPTTVHPVRLSFRFSSPRYNLVTHVPAVAISARQRTRGRSRTGSHGPRKRVRSTPSAPRDGWRTASSMVSRWRLC
jgi:hypothetical protein